MRKPDREVYMKLIGAGLPRTGTLTQKVALEMLGLSPCYHMVNVFADMDSVPVWQAALDGSPDWERLLGGFQATVDWPGGFFYRELAERHPDAKVLLSVRNPESWERSMRDTVWGVYHGDSLIRHLSSAMARVDPQWDAYLRLMGGLLWEGRGTLADGHETTEGMIAGMHRHEEEVRRTIEPDRLLVWDVSQGWEPLCQFLGVPVPEVPMPHVNDSATFVDRIVEMSLQKVGQWWDGQRAAAGQPVGAH